MHPDGVALATHGCGPRHTRIGNSVCIEDAGVRGGNRDLATLQSMTDGLLADARRATWLSSSCSCVACDYCMGCRANFVTAYNCVARTTCRERCAS
eukprot:scaffold76165_cov38-Tisochrysis_lutea.AAC.7